MIFFKSCPKCKGDLQEDHDMYGKFLSCLQCGYIKDISEDELKALKIRNGSKPVAYSS